MAHKVTTHGHEDRSGYRCQGGREREGGLRQEEGLWICIVTAVH
jgi:hypothetical protein